MVPGMGRNRQLRGLRVIPRVLGIATLILAAGCAAPAQESQEPSNSTEASVSASAEPTASPSSASSPTPTEAPVPTEPPSGRADIFEVVTTDLVMRSAPGTGADSEIYEPSLSAPMLLYILDGPVGADDYEWYRVIRFEEFYTDIGLPGPGVGWVAAAGKDGEAWIAPWTGTCPLPTALELMGRSPYLTLPCFGGRELTLEGIFRDCTTYGQPGVVAPWLGDCVLVPFGYEGQLLAGFGFYLESASAVANGEAVRVTGHFDDPASQSCVANPGGGFELTPPELIVLGCRGSFVATEITPTSAP
jgi:hypothetical protein